VAATFVASYGTGTLSAGATKTATVTTAVGDLLVMQVYLGNGLQTATTTPTGGTGLTWTSRADTNTTSDTQHARIKVYTATATTAETFTLSVGGGSTTEYWGWHALRFSGHGGYGGIATTQTGGSAPSLSYTTTAANSSLVLMVDDWNAVDGTTRTGRSTAGAYTETHYIRDATTLTAYSGYYANVGAVGAKTVGYSAPTGQLPSMTVVEVKAGTVTALSGNGATTSLALTTGTATGTIGYPVFTASSGAGDAVSLTFTISDGTGTSVGAGPLPAMVAWRNALKNRATTPATVLWIGDSLSEGQGASARANRWQDKVLAQLRTDLPTPGVAGGYGYVPTWYAVYTPDSTWSTTHRSTTGTVADLQQNPGDTVDKNLGLRHTNLAAGATLSMTVTGTSADVWWQQGYGSFTVAVDGGTPTTINTSGGTTGYPSKTTISLGATGSHTVLITATTASRVAGLMVYDGDETKGIRAVDAAHVGFFSDSYLGAGMQRAWQLVSPDLAVIELGVNDYVFAHQTSAQVKANLQTLISEIRAGVSKQVSIAVVIIAGTINSGSNAETYTAYRNAITAITTADPTVKLLDWGTITQTASDAFHPSNAGYTTLAGIIRPQITFDDKLGPAGALSLGLTLGSATGVASSTGSGATLTLALTPGTATGTIANNAGSTSLSGGGALLSLSAVFGTAAGASGTFGTGEALQLQLVPFSAVGIGIGIGGVWVFHTPTQDVWFRIAGRGLVGAYAQGLSVYRVDGQWLTRLSPSADDLAGADRIYQGGYAHVVSDAERADLIAAGFADNITLQEVS
jgi:lysophospholipase L1-like esterase